MKRFAVIATGVALKPMPLSALRKTICVTAGVPEEQLTSQFAYVDAMLVNDKYMLTRGAMSLIITRVEDGFDAAGPQEAQ